MDSGVHGLTAMPHSHSRKVVFTEGGDKKEVVANKLGRKKKKEVAKAVAKNVVAKTKKRKKVAKTKKVLAKTKKVVAHEVCSEDHKLKVVENVKKRKRKKKGKKVVAKTKEIRNAHDVLAITRPTSVLTRTKKAHTATKSGI